MIVFVALLLEICRATPATQVVGSAAVICPTWQIYCPTRLQMTPASVDAKGAIWHTRPINVLQPWNTTFTFIMGNSSYTHEFEPVRYSEVDVASVLISLCSKNNTFQRAVVETDLPL